jgi:hypothetical protein
MYVKFINLLFYFKVIFKYLFYLHINLFLRYYHANVDETRKKVREMIDNRDWKTNEFPDMKIKLLKKLNIDDYITNKPVDEFTLRKVLKEKL